MWVSLDVAFNSAGFFIDKLKDYTEKGSILWEYIEDISGVQEKYHCVIYDEHKQQLFLVYVKIYNKYVFVEVDKIENTTKLDSETVTIEDISSCIKHNGGGMRFSYTLGNTEGKKIHSLARAIKSNA